MPAASPDPRCCSILLYLLPFLRASARPSGAMFNIYHVSPHETQNPDEFVTEICYPVK